ncbi:L-glutamate gamma-semialdehyde dehydrogenase [Virgibacillus sp. Bac330]|uniref:L-glutamate gamma-semialdehyde dehydrogenase n=1 Tax=Virgibacillus sp. Bac330 TaxID=2419841 RepID=UPI000EF53C63|nr:L-glutamate gamma-semialdehyde dehydrogenase [Virgibacillus sp. Bac330]
MSISLFSNESPIIWKDEEKQQELKEALYAVKQKFGQQYPLRIAGEKIFTEDQLISYNPASFNEVIGFVSKAGKKNIDEAMDNARSTFAYWNLLTSQERARYLLKAAALMRRRKMEWIAWQIYEAGKNWEEADGEIMEAIDFLEMYARKAMELDQGETLFAEPGMENVLQYKPLGVGAIISPWNFPLAIVTGMTVAAIVTGNVVLLKPSSLTPVIAAKFVELMEEAGVPQGVIQFVPGNAAEIGDYMVGHKDVNFISFTGSKEAGLQIDEIAHRGLSEQRWMKRVVAEMGGKNGIIVDEFADLHAAVDGVIISAFGYQGQKCSACSRVIVHEKVYDRFIEQLVRKAKRLRVGSGEHNNDIGPVINNKAFDKVRNYIEIGKQEGRLVLGGESDRQQGYYVHPTIFTEVNPQARIMQEEIFGPVLAVCQVKDFYEGINVYNNTAYGLTGSVYSNKREHLAFAREHMECGNLFFNGKCTGAVVGMQPFGGYYMSGSGSKTGVKEYLLNFVLTKTISENY